ncbi:hypothetical protein JMM81_08495 [Bacillus sp. V3B]|uniref:hypothetical protein n=1 Tax=Bacillus sp. V3B TaxID=2804915 RepID=UPI00210DCD60|nr:hypothetical protein [Bacillus sp. V3B]MCQ6274999.1 hypothetical protein [Bacillus sp. V3B]
MALVFYCYMKEERWSTLIEQLHELGLVDEVFDANEILRQNSYPNMNNTVSIVDN